MGGVYKWGLGWIWEDFSFKKPHFPQANLDIWAPWEHMDKFLLFGQVKCNQFKLNTAYIARADVMLHSIYNCISINPINIHTPNGDGTGGIFLRFEDTHQGPIQTIASVDACLPIECASIVAQARPIAELFTASHPVRIELYANQSHSESSQPFSNSFALELSAPFALTFMGVQLDCLKLSAYQKASDIVVDPIIAGFAQGKIQGQMIVHMGAATPSLDLELSLMDAKHEQILKSVSYSKDFDKSSSLETVPTEASKGILDANFVGHVNLPDWSSFEGQGSLRLSDTDLGTIHFFGGLSRFLSNLHIPIGTLTLNEAVSTFTLKNQTLTFPNAEILGPTTRIAAQGNFYIPTQHLDFQMQIFPFGRVPVISTALIVLRPLTKAFQLHVSGSITEPKWQFSYLSPKSHNAEHTIE